MSSSAATKVNVANPTRGHSLVIGSGWQELAAYCLIWLHAKGF